MRLVARDCFLPIIYEDEDLLVLNKASGVPTLPHTHSETETAVGAALAHAPVLAQVGGKPLEPGLLHRLDTGTSGLLVFAKSETEFQRLRQVWKTGWVKKIYRALVKKKASVYLKQIDFKKLPYTISYPMGHSAKSSKKMIVFTSEKKQLSLIRGKPLKALTVIKKIGKLGPDFFDLEIEIKTGVMHQIRCHLAAISWPIVGDSVYKGMRSSRLWLHAWKLVLPLKTGVLLDLEAELPKGWSNTP